MTDQLRYSQGAQRALPERQQRRGTDLRAKLDKRKARSVCHACNQLGHCARDRQCPGRPVNMIELQDDVQEFETNQNAGMRQVLSVQVDVPDVRLLRPSTRLVLAMNSMDVGRREGARGVIDTAARYTVTGRAWDRAYHQICVERGIGTPSAWRLSLRCIVLESEACYLPPNALQFLLCSEDLVWTSKVAARLWSTMVAHNRLKTRWLDIIV